VEDRYGATQPGEDRHRARALAISDDLDGRARSREGLVFAAHQDCHPTSSVGAAGAAGRTFTPNPIGPSDPTDAASPTDHAPTARTAAALARLRRYGCVV
jgi:hypothetical protein